MREEMLHFLLHVGQFVFIMHVIFFSWLSFWVMNFNKNNIDHCSKYASQHGCNYRDPPPIISSPVREKKNNTKQQNKEEKRKLLFFVTPVSTLSYIWQWKK